MTRAHLRHLKLLREISFLAAAIGFILVLFDWLLWRLMLPTGPWWLRIAGDAAGLALLAASARISRHAKTLGRRKPADPTDC